MVRVRSIASHKDRNLLYKAYSPALCTVEIEDLCSRAFLSFDTPAEVIGLFYGLPELFPQTPASNAIIIIMQWGCSDDAYAALDESGKTKYIVANRPSGPWPYLTCPNSSGVV